MQKHRPAQPNEFAIPILQVYPGRDITNIVESSHYQKIGGWCRQGSMNAAKCKGAQRWIKPFRCLGKYSPFGHSPSCCGGCSHNQTQTIHLMRFCARASAFLYYRRQRDHSSRTRCSCRRAASSITFTIRRVAGRSAAGIRPDRLHARSAACRCAALPCCCRVAFLCSRALSLYAAPSTSKVSDKIRGSGVFFPNVLNRGRGGRGRAACR